MKNGGVNVAVTALFTVLIAMLTLIFAAVLGKENSDSLNLPFVNGESASTQSANVNNENYNQSSNSSETVSNITSSEETAPPESEYPYMVTGVYRQGENNIIIKSFDLGFIEGNVDYNGITMDFLGQMVENTLKVTGNDSLSNTVEIVLVFEENKILAVSRPVIQYEENAPYLSVEGEFKKQEEF